MLLIENKGVAPEEAFTLLGMSTSRNNDGCIGQFGSGAKHAVNVLLRAGLEIRIYCGKDRLDFGTERGHVDGHEVTHVTISTNKRKPKRLGWVLEYGELDWTEVRMGLREFISNAIDRSIKDGGSHDDVDIVMNSKPQAKAGFTRVYISEDVDVVAYYNDLDKHFLHFGPNLGQTVIHKSFTSPCRVYRKGVFVCELSNSLFDYDLDYLAIDECRNANEYSVRAEIAKHFRRTSSVADLTKVFRSLITGDKTVEFDLDQFYLSDNGTISDERKEAWQQAWGKVAGKAIPCPNDQQALEGFANRKGLETVLFPKGSSWINAMKLHGIKFLDDVLDSNEREGRTVTPPSDDAREAVNTVWGWINDANMSAGRSKPRVRGFDDMMEAGSECRGYYQPGDSVVYLRNDIGGADLLQTALEEVAHYVTGATDNSRDFQDFAFRLITRWLA